MSFAFIVEFMTGIHADRYVYFYLAVEVNNKIYIYIYINIPTIPTLVLIDMLYCFIYICLVKKSKPN